MLIIFLLYILFVPSVLTRTKEEWKSRVLYQLLTDRFSIGDGSKPSCSLSSYCGGNWKGIEANIPYIQSLGANAIWISPIVSNTDNGYHGYWMNDLYSLNSHFGSEQDFIDLVTACHDNDIWIMVDVVGNHVGPIGSDFSKIKPFNSNEHYHDYCDINQDDFLHNQWRVENCRLAKLPDLKHENTYVQSTLISWINDFTSKYNIDGLRIDTIPEVPKSFWKSFSQSSGVFTIGEVFDGRVDYVSGYQGSVDAVLNYPLYFQLKNVFLYNHPMNEMETFYNSMKIFPDQTILGCFIDNHDNSRFLSINSNYNSLKNYINYNLGTIGIPIIYYGTEQGFSGGNDPNNRESLWNNLNTNHEIYKFIQIMLKARKQLGWYNQPQIQRFSDNQIYSFSRGKNIFFFTNQKGQISKTITYHPFNNGDVICNIFYANNSDCITIQNNKFTIYLVNGETKVYVIKNGENYSIS